MKKITLLLLLFTFYIPLEAQTYVQENFDTEIPATWTITDAGETTGDSWFSGMHDGDALDGTNSAIVDSDENGNGVHLIETLTSPVFDASNATFLYFDFDQFYNNINTDSAIVEVFDGTNWIELLNQTSDVGALNAPDQQHIDISAYKNSTMQIRFVYDDDDKWAWYWMIDNVHIYNTTCNNPSDIVAGSITEASANITWSDGGSEDSWEIVVQLAGTGEPTGSGTPTSDTFFDATTLNVSTTYEIYLRSNCGTDGFSAWSGPILFTTASAPAPITFTEQSISTSGTNRAVVDMNGDFLDDIVSISDTNINIQHQQAGGGFNETNITTTSADFTPSWSLAAADFDANGYTDLLYGAGSGVTFMKANSDGTAFTEISGSENVFSQRSNFIDINNDGYLDAFVCHDVAPNVYYLNDGSGNLTFYQGGDANGVPNGLGVYSSGGNYGSIWIDYDNDGDLDMFIAKCGGEIPRRTNQMHRNEGNGDFLEVATAIGLDDPMQTWSSAWGDYDNDGDMDVFVGASSGTHKLMRNDIDTSGTFTEVTNSSGVLALTATGIENVTYDFNNDGNLDIASNGNILFGNGDLTFSSNINIVPNGGSFGDLNNDGFIDAFGGTIYMNDTNANNWITINTIGTVSNINGIGARIVLETSSGTQIRDVRSGDGFRYMNTLNSHFGIGTDTAITSITITWPSGIVDEILNPNTNQTLTAIEGDNPLSIHKFLVNNLILYPNPTTHSLNLNASYNFSKANYTVFDMTGRLVIKGKFDSNAIDVSRLQSGNYILQVSNEGVKTAQKFIKK